MWKIIQADAGHLPIADASVHCVVTSPPYWGLRDYGVDGQIGLEESFDEFLAKMVDVFREVRRVLRDDGVAWVNMGDGYAQQAGRGAKSNSDHSAEGWPGRGERYTETSTISARSTGIDGLKPKGLIGQPWRLAFALQSDGWYLRSDCIWSKPNPMPESVRDRPTKAHEYVFLLTKRPRYFYDADAVREDSVSTWNSATFNVDHGKNFDLNSAGIRTRGADTFHRDEKRTGRNMRSVWTIPTQSFPGAHFATFPERLAERCIMAGTSDRGCCSRCGAPVVRQTQSRRVATRPGKDNVRDDSGMANRDYERHVTERETTGWAASCECGADAVPCVVFDPFAGSGTTGVAARRLGRHFVGTELNPEYAAMAQARIRNPEARFDEKEDVDQGVFSWD